MKKLRRILCSTTLAFLSTRCGAETTEDSVATTRPEAATATHQEPSRVETHIPRILTADEIGEDYLRYAAQEDLRIQQTVRCEADLATQSGSALRPSGIAGALTSVEWVYDAALPSDTEGITQLRYRAQVTAGEDTQTVEGVLTFGYDDENRSYYVSCPPEA